MVLPVFFSQTRKTGVSEQGGSRWSFMVHLFYAVVVILSFGILNDFDDVEGTDATASCLLGLCAAHGVVAIVTTNDPSRLGPVVGVLLAPLQTLHSEGSSTRDRIYVDHSNPGSRFEQTSNETVVRERRPPIRQLSFALPIWPSSMHLLALLAGSPKINLF